MEITKSSLKSGATDLAEIRAESSFDVTNGFTRTDWSVVKQPKPFETDELVAWLQRSPILSTVKIRKDGDKVTLQAADAVGHVYRKALDDDGSTCCVCGSGFETCKGIKTELKPFCVSECIEDTMDVLLQEAGWNPLQSQDMENPYAKKGESIGSIQSRKMLTEFAFYADRVQLLGTLTGTGNGLRPMFGLLEGLSDASVVSFTGAAGILPAIEALECRDIYTGASDWGIAVHPLTKKSLIAKYRKMPADQRPSGVTVGENSISFNGKPVLMSYHVPADVATGFGEAWVVNRNGAGLFPLLKSPKTFVDTTMTNTPDTANTLEGCLKKCIYIYNAYGLVLSGYDAIVRITDIPLDQHCLAGMFGLDVDELVQPDSPFMPTF